MNTVSVGKIDDDAKFLFDDSISKDEKLKMIDDLKPYFHVHCVASEALLLEILQRMREKNLLCKEKERYYHGDEGRDVYTMSFKFPNAGFGDYEKLTLNEYKGEYYLSFDIYDYSLGGRTGLSYQNAIKKWKLETADCVLKQIYRDFVKRYY